MISYLKIVITCLDAPQQHFLALLIAPKTYPALRAGSLPSLCCGSWTFPVPFLPVSHVVCLCCATQPCHTGVHPQRVMCVLHVRSLCLSVCLSQHCCSSWTCPVERPHSWLRAALSASCTPAVFLGCLLYAVVSVIHCCPCPSAALLDLHPGHADQPGEPVPGEDSQHAQDVCDDRPCGY